MLPKGEKNRGFETENTVFVLSLFFCFLGGKGGDEKGHQNELKKEPQTGRWTDGRTEREADT